MHQQRMWEVEEMQSYNANNTPLDFSYILNS